MDRRRFFGRGLNESFYPVKNTYSLEEAFEDLDRLYEDADQEQEAPATDTKAAGNISDIQKEVQKIDVEQKNIKLSGKAADLYDQLIDILQKSNLESAVKTLEIVAADPKLSLLLRHGFTDGSDENERVDVSISDGTAVPVANMIPTQKEIGTDGSLKNILTGKHPGGEVVFDDYFKGGAVASMPGPFVYQDGSSYYIIDGHHRWSQTYCLNPHASLNCKVLTSSTKLSVEEVLKNFQAAIAADAARSTLGRKAFEGENFFTFAKNAQSVIGYLNGMSEEVATKIASNAKKALQGEVAEAVKAYGDQITTGSENQKTAIAWVTKNAVKLAGDCEKHAANNPTRLLMPQSDGNTFEIVKDTLAVGKNA